MIETRAAIPADLAQVRLNEFGRQWTAVGPEVLAILRVGAIPVSPY